MSMVTSMYVCSQYHMLNLGHFLQNKEAPKMCRVLNWFEMLTEYLKRHHWQGDSGHQEPLAWPGSRQCPRWGGGEASTQERRGKGWGTEVFVLTSLTSLIVQAGGWINWHFSGFVTTKVASPLTLPVKPMLQRGNELQSLDTRSASSVSWYFLNVFSLRSIYSDVLSEKHSAD